jgi:ATP synthase protein I
VKREYKAIGSFGTLGLEVVLCMLFGFFAGYWIDGKLDTRPYLSVLGLTFGIGAAIKSILRAVREMRAVTEKEEREQGNPAPMIESPETPEQRDARDADR